MNASTARVSRCPSTARGLCSSISMPMRANELRSLNRSSVRCSCRNSNSAGWRGQKASVRVTVRSSLFFTVRIWPSRLVQNWSGFMGRGSILERRITVAKSQDAARAKRSCISPRGMAWDSVYLMKYTLPLSAGLVACAFLAAASAQDINFSVPPSSGAAPAAGAPAAAAAPAQAFTENQMAEEIGWIMAKRTGVGDLEFTPDQIAGLLKGMSSALSGTATPPYDPQAIGPQMEAFMQKKQGAYLAKLKQSTTVQSEA